MVLPILITAVVGYLLGNLNGAIVVARLIAHEDVRTKGSGNAGLTNFTRNYGSKTSIFVILIDMGKAIAACALGGLLLKQYDLYEEGVALGGLAVILGHDFPALLGFKGGKGILSGWFIAWVIDWRIGLLIFIVFAAAYGFTRFVSLGSVLAAVTFGVAFAALHHDNLVMLLCGLAMSLLTLWMHRGNIVRLCKGEERKTNLFATGKQS